MLFVDHLLSSSLSAGLLLLMPNISALIASIPLGSSCSQSPRLITSFLVILIKLSLSMFLASISGRSFYLSLVSSYMSL